MVHMTAVTWVLAALLGAVDVYAVRRADHRLETIAKPLAVVAILVAGVTTGLLSRDWGVVLTLGLMFGLIGDVLLLEETRTRFMAGLASFLGGHLLYVAAFVMVGLSWTPWLAVAVVVTLGALVVGREVLPATWRADGAAMAAPVAAYMVVLTGCTLSAAATDRPLVALGGICFIVSDTVLAMDRFVRPRASAHVVIMVTYLLAQALIVGGMSRG